MSVLIDEESRVIVQGITGRQGRFHTKSMLDYGTRIVAGVTPGKAGQKVEGVPVYDSVSDVGEDFDASILFVPARFAKKAVEESVNAGAKLVVPITEGVPVHDSLDMIRKADGKAVIIGPNTPGIISPGKSKLGIMPGHIFREGGVAVVSRSGTLTYEIVAELSKSGIGQSTAIGLGGDPIVGTGFKDALKKYREDEETRAVVLVGEIGGDAEEKAAEWIRDTGYEKPVVAYVVGRAAPPGKRMGHAGAIVSGGSGSYASKKKAFQNADIPFARTPAEITRIVKGLL